MRPPKIFWFSKKDIFYFVCSINNKQKFLEFLVQFFWILYKIIIYIGREKYTYKKIPFDIYLKACIFNSFNKNEILAWIFFGLNDWNQISKKIPNNQSSYFHLQRRVGWPECQKIKALLSNKKNLYDFVFSKEIIPKYIIINKIQKTFPSWVEQALMNEGLIIKPNSGYGGKDIFHYFFKDKKLFSKNLITQKKNNIYFEKNKLESILKNWRINTKSKDFPLLTPYIKNPDCFPKSLDSVNIRVITNKKNKNSKAYLTYCWLEIPLQTGNLFISQNGLLLNIFNKEISKTLKKNIDEWITAVTENSKLLKDIEFSIENSKNLHNFLSEIDSVAWDWIPSANLPKLLEGNSDFGFFIPQLIDHINKKIYN